MTRLFFRSAGALLLIACGSAALADGVSDRTMAVANRWAQIKYRMPEAQQLEAMTALKGDADALAKAAPNRAEPLIWDGIVTSTLAGLKGGLGGLARAKEARDFLERAEKIDGNALDGSAHTSLGALLYQVPGWPVGFGDKTKARTELMAGIRANPAGIDSNYFWGDFLYRQGDYAGAARALKTAMSAAPRAGREVADAGRRKEVQALLATVNGKLGG